MGAKKLYGSDFSLWLNENINALQKRDLNKMDINNIIEELRGMGISQKNELKSRLIVLMSHILKWIYQPSYRNPHWVGTIKEQRCHIRMVLEESPSLKKEIRNYCNLQYKDAVDSAMDETRLPIETFPKSLELTEFDILEKSYEMPDK